MITMTRDELITQMSELMASLQVPVSMNRLGRASTVWTELHSGLTIFGWQKAGDYERAIRAVLDADQQ